MGVTGFMVIDIWFTMLLINITKDQLLDIFVILFQNIDILACLINFYYLIKIYCSSEIGSENSLIWLGYDWFLFLKKYLLKNCFQFDSLFMSSIWFLSNRNKSYRFTKFIYLGKTLIYFLKRLLLSFSNLIFKDYFLT